MSSLFPEQPQASEEQYTDAIFIPTANDAVASSFGSTRAQAVGEEAIRIPTANDAVASSFAQAVGEEVPVLEEEKIEEQPVPLSSPLSPPPEAQLPPEAQGETNGGPLGCCLGTVVGLLLTFLLTTTASIALANGGFLSFATIPVIVLGTILGGYFGWRVGKRVYREYDPPVVKRRKPFMNYKK